MTAPPPQPPPHDPPAAERARGLGGLLLTEVERVDLGTHGGYALHARVERRSARLTAGRGGRLSFGLGHTRAVAVEAASSGARYDLPVSRSRDAWLTTARALVALWCVGQLAIYALRRARHRAPRSRRGVRA